MSSDEASPEAMTFRETSQPEISGYRVGISNIWERDLPDSEGLVASRVSALLTIHDPVSRQTRRQEVFAGSTVSLGEDRYCVVSVEEGRAEPGVVTFRKIS